jgi:phosphohistidine phosphatase
LAPRGKRDSKALGKLIGRDAALLAAGVPLPQIALVSPAARTAATAELALAELPAPPLTHLVDDLYGAEPEEVLDHLRTLPGSITSVMVVGHNPTVHALSQGLIDADDTDGHDLALRRGFPTCALGVYAFSVEHWHDVGARTARLAGLSIPPFENS